MSSATCWIGAALSRNLLVAAAAIFPASIVLSFILVITLTFCSISDSGAAQIKRRVRGGPGERWDAAERAILTGLAAHDLTDVFPRLHGYGVAEYSWRLKRHGEFTDRRFDHLFASAALNAVACRYMQAWWEAGLSDHSALEVKFEPQFGQSRSVGSTN